MAPAGHVIEPRQQVDERGLAGAAAADDRDHLSRAYREGHALERVASVAVLVAEHHVAKFDRVAKGGQRPSRSAASWTSVCRSSSSKIRSSAATACCRLALTRLSFLTGPYINSSAATNDVNSPAVSRLSAISRLPYQSAPAIAKPPRNSISGGSTDRMPVTFRFVR